MTQETKKQPDREIPQADGSAVIDVAQLFADGRRLVTLRHGNQEYHLRLTRSNKLILTK